MFEPGMMYGLEVNHDKQSLEMNYNTFVNFDVMSNIVNVFYNGDTSSGTAAINFSTLP